MKVKQEKVENKANEVKLEITVESEKFQNAIQDVFHKNAKYFNIPGFRKGKAPFKMVEKTYGIQIFYEDAFNEVADVAYRDAIKQENLEVVSKPKIDIIQIESGKDLIFTAVVATKPEVKLGEYKGIELKKVEYNVSDKDIDDELTQMAERNARLITVEDKAAENGDVTIIDFEGFVDGVAFEGGKAENHELTLGSKTFIPGFEEQVVGMKTGDEKDVVVKFPEDYFSKDLAGKDATFKVKLHQIKKKELPKIDDEFAKDVSEFDTLEELKKSIKEKKEKSNTERAKHELEDMAIKEISDKSEVDIPEGMIELEIDNIEQDISARLSYQGMNFEQYLTMMGKTREEFRKEYKEIAEKQIKTRLVLETITKEAKIAVSEEEITNKLKEMAQNYGKKEEDVKDNLELRKYIETSLKAEKTIDYIITNAKIK